MINLIIIIFFFILSTNYSFGIENLFERISNLKPLEVSKFMDENIKFGDKKDTNSEILAEYIKILEEKTLLKNIDKSYEEFLEKGWRKYKSSEIFENINEIKEPNYRDSIIDLKSLGYHIVVLEGEPYIEIDYNSVLDRYSKYISNWLLDYLSIKSKTMTVFYDAGVTISWNELFELIILMERYENNSKNSKEYSYRLEYIEGLKENYIKIYFTGVDNRQIFNEDSSLDKNVKESYEKNKVLYKEYEAGKKLNEYYELLKKNGFKKRKEVIKYLNEMEK